MTGGRLAGRTAIVTGAGQGVGEGIARAFAVEGANVVIAARRAETGEPAAAAIRERGGEATCIVTDVTSREAMAACVDATVERYGALEVMVHNAYRGGVPHRLEELTLDLWEQNSRTAVLGLVLQRGVGLPASPARRTPGRLVAHHVAVGRGGQRQPPRVLAREGRAAGDGEEPVEGVGAARASP